MSTAAANAAVATPMTVKPSVATIPSPLRVAPAGSEALPTKAPPAPMIVTFDTRPPDRLVRQ